MVSPTKNVHYTGQAGNDVMSKPAMTEKRDPEHHCSMVPQRVLKPKPAAKMHIINQMLHQKVKKIKKTSFTSRFLRYRPIKRCPHHHRMPYHSLI